MNLSQLMQKQNERRFPKNCYDLKIAALPRVDLVSIDSDVAGCAASYQSRGRLNSFQLGVLKQNLELLPKVLKHLSGEAFIYYEAWYQIGQLVLEKIKN